MENTKHESGKHETRLSLFSIFFLLFGNFAFSTLTHATHSSVNTLSSLDSSLYFVEQKYTIFESVDDRLNNRCICQKREGRNSLQSRLWLEQERESIQFSLFCCPSLTLFSLSPPFCHSWWCFSELQTIAERTLCSLHSFSNLIPWFCARRVCDASVVWKGEEARAPLRKNPPPLYWQTFFGLWVTIHPFNLPFSLFELFMRGYS